MLLLLVIYLSCAIVMFFSLMLLLGMMTFWLVELWPLRCMAVISDMDQPLGNTIGNSLEIEESIEILKGNGSRDITDLVLTLGSEMVVLARKATTLEEAREMLIETIVSQKALEKFGKMITSQGGIKEF